MTVVEVNQDRQTPILKALKRSERSYLRVHDLGDEKTDAKQIGVSVRRINGVPSSQIAREMQSPGGQASST